MFQSTNQPWKKLPNISSTISNHYIIAFNRLSIPSSPNNHDIALWWIIIYIYSIIYHHNPIPFPPQFPWKNLHESLVPASTRASSTLSLAASASRTQLCWHSSCQGAGDAGASWWTTRRHHPFIMGSTIYHGKTIGKPWEYGKIIGKSWENKDLTPAVGTSTAGCHFLWPSCRLVLPCLAPEIPLQRHQLLGRQRSILQGGAAPSNISLLV